MDQYYIIIVLIICLVNTFLAFFLLSRNRRTDTNEVKNRFEALEKNQQRLENIYRDEMSRSREENNINSRHLREETNSSLKSFGTMMQNRMDSFQAQMNNLNSMNETKLEKIRETVEQKLSAIQADNNQKLEKMRETVDEKLHATLQTRLDDSFKIVSERLELVHKGLGEMQSLANGVCDLKRVLTNVKTRGTLGEIQLENILEQILTTEQYAKNAAVKKGSNDRVEFAIRMPGKGEENSPVWLPIDAKFPLEDYQKLLTAYDKADSALVEESARQLENRIKACAKDIREKYLDPPNTTDFGIMFLPIEGLYAEVLRRTGLFETLQRDYRVIAAGPTVLSALLNSLQIGFSTLAIEKRSSEVWNLLGAVKTEFGKFGIILEKTHKKLLEASNTIEDASKKTRTIQRKLKNVQELPTGDFGAITENGDDEEEDGLV